MENQTKTGKWSQFWKSLNDPWFIVPIAIGLLLIIPVFKTTDEYWKTTLTGLSTILISIGVTYYGFIISDKSKYNNLMIEVNKGVIAESILKEKVRSSCRSLDLMIDYIINNAEGNKRPLTRFEKRLIGDIGVILDSHKDNYQSDYSSKLSEYMRVRADVQHETDADKKQALALQQENFQHLFVTRNYKPYTDATGSLQPTDDRYFKPDQFMGSSGLTNEPTFKSPDDPETE